MVSGQGRPVSWGALEDAAAVPSLIWALEDSARVARSSATHSLGDLRDPRAFQPLVNLLNDEASGVRESAVLTLGRLGDPRPVPHLTQCLTLTTTGWFAGRLNGPLSSCEAHSDTD